VSGVDSPGSGTASTFSAVRGRPLPGARSMDPVVRNRSESLQRHTCSISCLEIP